VIDLRFVARDLRRLDETSAEVVACGVFRDERPLGGLAGLLDWRLAGRLSRLAKQAFLTGEVGEVFACPVRPRLPFDKVIVVGLGPRAAFGDATFRQATERILTTLEGLSVKKAVIELPGRAANAIEAERAAEIALELLEADERDAITLVEDVEAQRRMEKHALDRRRTVLRAQNAAAR
jgi:hypothetical protein